MAYFHLILAIIFEVTGTLMLPATKSFTKLLPTLFLFISYGVSFYFLALVSQKLPLAIISATWAGMGVFLIAVFSYFIYKQPLQWQAVVGLCLIVIGVAIVNSFKVEL